ncbi:MAG: Hpt domain-containing protein [Proteobacteria bacterium]|nr:Hpt domain-containing protein [Pseudomonadota bacterium]
MELEKKADLHSDIETALERLGGDLILLQELTNILSENLPLRIAAIEEAINQNDAEALCHTAHSLKGAIGNFSTGEAYQALADLERMGRINEMSGAFDILARVKQETRTLEMRLRSLVEPD